MPVQIALVGEGLVGSRVRALLHHLPFETNVAVSASSKVMKFSTNSSNTGMTNGNNTDSVDETDAQPQPTDLSIITAHMASLRSAGDICIWLDLTCSALPGEQYAQLLSSGVHVVTANKITLAATEEIWDVISDARLIGKGQLKFEASVGAGLPVLCTMRDLLLTGDRIQHISGIFSGTMAFIFNNFCPSTTSAEPRPTFSQIVKQAKLAGYTEPNPAADLSGTDVARKLTILARATGALFSLPLGAASVDVQSLVPDTIAADASVDEFMAALEAEDAQWDARRSAAEAAGCVLRYVGTVDVRSGQVCAKLEQLPVGHPMAQMKGSDNMVLFQTERYSSPLVIMGAGAGDSVTAMGVLADIGTIYRENGRGCDD